MMEAFEAVTVPVGESHIFLRKAGHGPAVLLLHGFPETHLMWRGVAALLAARFTVVCADLPGYGQSGCWRPEASHAPHSKRAMATALVVAMAKLGFPRFSVVGHDRGGRVAYRLALDHPDRLDCTACLDVLPIETVWERADARLMLGFWPFALLAQSPPLPERVLSASADAIVDHALQEWGTPRESFPDSVRAAYVAALRDPAHAQAICEEYRAAATIDRDHDRADLHTGRKIRCPLLVLWSARGPLGSWYTDDGGPLELWRPWAENLAGHGIDGGHFFPEEAPGTTAAALARFLLRAAA